MFSSERPPRHCPICGATIRRYVDRPRLPIRELHEYPGARPALTGLCAGDPYWARTRNAQ